MKEKSLVLVLLLVVLVISSALVYILSTQKPPSQASQSESAPQFILGTLYGKVVDPITHGAIVGAKVRIFDSTPFSDEEHNSVTNSSGYWHLYNVNLTEPIFIDIEKQGYYPPREHNGTVVKLSENLFDFGWTGILRVSSNYTFSVSTRLNPFSYTFPYYTVRRDGDQISVARKDTLTLIISLVNNDKTAFLGQGPDYVSTVSMWVFPMADTVALNFNGQTGVGRVDWKIGQLGYIGNNVGGFADLRFQEIGNYTLFIRLTDYYEIYTAMTIHVNVSNL